MSAGVATAPRRAPASRALWIAAAVLAAFVVLALAADRLAPEPEGPRSSSYATAPAGAAAWASLLDRRGRRVVRLRDRPRAAVLDPGATVVALDPGALPGADRTALARFVRRGGRLVVAGEGSAVVAGALLARRPVRAGRGPRIAAPLVPAPEAPGTVRTAGRGAWTDPGQALPVLGGRDGDLVLLARAGRGTLVLLADASPLQNRLLGRDANAALGLALAPRGRPVAFVESVHGYGRATGLAALPSRWKALLIGLGLAAAVWMLAHARRFGPAETDGRPGPPPRRLYVDALGRTLGRTGDPARAAAPVHAAARRLVLARAGLPAGAGEQEVRTAAARLGLDDDEARTVAAPRLARGDVMTAGRALARLHGGGR